jgi:hypothetical protein
MYALMCLQIALLTEWFPALITGILLHLTMHKLKFIQSTLEKEMK